MVTKHKLRKLLSPSERRKVAELRKQLAEPMELSEGSFAVYPKTAEDHEHFRKAWYLETPPAKAPLG